jgi:NAD(P)-dependent dehydrogenase (short-subunit alcohol dehydrogenase family)
MNKNAIITGAAKGIGKIIASQLADNGVNIALCDIAEEQLNATLHELAKKKIKVYGQKVDVSQEKAVNEFVNNARKELGTIEILINNAGLYILHTIDKISVEEWDTVMAVNLKSCFLFAKAVLPEMINKKYGRIINITSAAGKSGGTVCGIHYAASKGGMIAFTRHLAKQVGKYGITVNAIAPASIATDMVLKRLTEEEKQQLIKSTVVDRLGDPLTIADAVKFLIGDNSGFITGETININGGSLMD